MSLDRGAWQRAGISRDGGPFAEDEHVVWLQVGEYYADSRGFAGTTVRDGATVRFNHEFGELGEDVGQFAPAGAHLVETGRNTDGSTFVELWAPLPVTDDQSGAWQYTDTQTVRVGQHVVHVTSTTGTYHQLPS